MNVSIACPDAVRFISRWLILMAAALSGAQALGAQVCTTQQVGNKEFNGIFGTADDSVIAVAKKGLIYRYDGTDWLAMENPNDEDLNAVHSLSDTGFAVGKKGEVLQLVSGSWSPIGGFTKEDLLSVWAASTTEVYAGDNKGGIHAWDGSSWADLSAAAGTGKKDIVDIHGAGQWVVALDEDGVLYRYDRSTGSWAAPDSSCTAGKKFTSLWSDDAGAFYLTAKKEVWQYTAGSCALATAASEDLNGVYGWSATGEPTAVGKKGLLLESDDGNWQESSVGDKELNDVWVSGTGNAYFAGKNKTLTVCECTDCTVGGEPQFLITHDGYGIHCSAEAVQVGVYDALSGLPKTDYDRTVVLDSQGGRGTWSLLSGNGSLTDAVADDGVAEYAWATGDTDAVFALDYPAGPAAIDVDVFEAGDPTLRDTDAEGLLEFSASGFSLTAAPLPNPVTGVVAPFALAQSAGSEFAIHIAAYGQTPGDPDCGVIESYDGSKTLELWMDHQDPATGTRLISIDGIAVGAAENLAAVGTIEFANGQASVIAKYKDAGRVRLQVADKTAPDPDLPDGIRGATAGFVVKPFDFILSGIADGSGNANPAAADHTGEVFVAAGEAFSATVTARDAEGDPTPNYGRESIPESIALSPSLIAPAGGSAPPVAAATGFANFAGGSATATDLSWPEVGIVGLTPAVGDGDYLGAGDVIGVETGPVGRFVPDHFDTSTNLPLFATACAAGNFTYVGQPFGYAVAPVVTVTAKALGGQTTQNYTGNFFKLTTAGLADPVYTASAGVLDTALLPGGAADPVVAPLPGGQGTLTFSAGGGLAFERAAAAPEFDADIRLSQSIEDADGVTATTNPAVFGALGGIGFDQGAAMRYGRLRLTNAYGSERIDLAVPLTSEVFIDASTGFVPHADDSCTTTVSVAFTGYGGNLGAGDTCVLDTGAPGSSGSGCTAPASPGRQFRTPPVAGDFNLYLAAPGDGNDGSAELTADAPSWLEFDWDAAASGTEDPQATAVFGIYGGSNRLIYIREITR